MAIGRFFSRLRSIRTSLVSPLSARPPLVPCASVTRLRWRHSTDANYWFRNLGVVLSAQTVLIFGLSGSPALAQERSDATETAQEEDYISGLRKIEDGSVVSNEHTSKWRIFTDNGRELSFKGKLVEAEKYFKLAIDEAKEGFGPKDPHVASSCNNLAELYRIKREYGKAEPFYLEAINILEESYGADDIRVGAALHNLGQFYLVQNKLDRAQSCYERALKIKGRIMGHGNPDYANTMYHLGKVLYLQGKENDAEDIMRESIRILEEAGLSGSPTCTKRMRYLIQIYLRSSRLTEAENLQRKMLHILELSNGWESIETVFAAETLALTLQSLGNLKESEELLKRCLAARSKILPDGHVQLARNYLLLARAALFNAKHFRKDDTAEANAELDKAKQYLNDAIRISKTSISSSRDDQQKRQGISSEGDRDRVIAFIMLLQALELVGQFETSKHSTLPREERLDYPFEAEQALRECLSLFKEPMTQHMLTSVPDVKAEYVTCLNHLSNLVRDFAEETGRSKELQGLMTDVEQTLGRLLGKQHK